jgi:hypothetical protein
MIRRNARFLPLVLLLLPLSFSACGSDKPSGPTVWPDLQVISMTFDPPNPSEGQSVLVSAVVKNAGTADAPATIAGVTLGGTQKCMDLATRALPIGEADTVACNLAPPPVGTQGVGVCADVTGLIDEPDEGNNCMLRFLTVTAGSSLP